MKKLLITLLLIVGLFHWAQAQFGVRAQLALATIQSDVAEQSPPAFEHQGIQVGAWYWFRLKNIRIEFTPELSYGYFKHDQATADISTTFEMKQFGLSVPINIYPFDFDSDCGCPTFAIDNDFIQKGLFFQLIPAYFISTFELLNGTTVDDNQNNYAGIGAGVGLDIGINDLITVTPLINYFHYPLTSDSEPRPVHEQDVRFGLRFSFRPDYQRATF